MDVEQLRQDVADGAVGLDRMVELIASQQKLIASQQKQIQQLQAEAETLQKQLGKRKTPARSRRFTTAEKIARAARTEQVYPDDCKEMNRPVRTRMPGGVGGVPEQSGLLSRCTPGMGVS
jgi:cell division protein FtsB